jgi:hypothetical protein
MSWIPARVGVNNVLSERCWFAHRSFLPLYDGHASREALVRLIWRRLRRTRGHFAKHLFGGDHTGDEGVVGDSVRPSVV